jgi:outer membrane protein OmpA-like peptidoglycan-associated protein
MYNRPLLTLILILSIQTFGVAQTDTYTVTPAPFSSDEYDEYSPVYYKNGIVFCTNRNSGSLSDYSSSHGKASFNIYYIDTTRKVSWSKAELFSKNLKTRFNDGPVTFSRSGDTVYFSRNLRVEGSLKELSGFRNSLGVFSASYDDKEKEWDKIQEFRFNSEWYNITTPFLTMDGLRLYFASDRPDGYGGSDIYYSQWKNGYWNDPVNLGPLINTSGNESYPFINEAGEFFFSSDGHMGLGGKDIFVTKQQSSGWYPPVGLEAPINSEFDDFGIVTDPLMTEGYFSSGRGKTIDIYQFKSNRFQFWFSELQKDNQYCFSISDTGSIKTDTIILQYVWDFGDETDLHGTSVRHCFPGPGTYGINLDIIDRRTGKLFFRKLSYDIEIVDIDQPYINSADVSLSGETIELDGLRSNCRGYSIMEYFWDFGDGTYGYGEKVSHVYSTSGEFDVRMGLTLKSIASGDIVRRVVTKKLRVLQGEQDRASYLSGRAVEKKDLTDIRQFENVIVNGHYSAEADFRKEAVFMVELLSSPEKLANSSSFFRNLPAKYSVKEIFDSETGLYSYIADQQMNLMDTYPAYREIIASGLKDCKVKIVVLKDPAEKELLYIRKNYSLFTDTYFDVSNRLTTSAYIMLDQVVALMNRYPAIKMEIGLHTDNQGVAANFQWLSQFRAQVIVSYLISRGISNDRLKARGYGNAKPISSNINESGRRVNRRVDFTILN